MTKTFTAVQMIGTQRSGSNLLRLMLDQLDEVSAPHPPHILARFVPLLAVYGDLATPANFARLVDDVCRLVECNPVPWEGVVLDRHVIMARCDVPTLTEIFRVIYELRAESKGARIWICKSLASVHFASQLEERIKPFYLHLFRDGRDVALSFEHVLVGEKHIYHIARQWKEEQEAAIQLRKQLGDCRVIQVRYEDLLANPVKELRRVCVFIGAEYDAKALEYYRSAESHNTAHAGVLWENVEKPIMRDNFNKFRRELSEEEVLLFEQVAGDTLERLGYVRCFPNAGERVFSSAEIAQFLALNEKLKQSALSTQRLEDLQKRKGQEDLLREVQNRMAGA